MSPIFLSLLCFQFLVGNPGHAMLKEGFFCRMEKKHLWKPSEKHLNMSTGSTSVNFYRWQMLKWMLKWWPEGATKSRNICPLCAVDRRSTWTIPDRKNHLQIEHCEYFICFRNQYWIDVARVILPRILPHEQRSCLWVSELLIFANWRNHQSVDYRTHDRQHSTSHGRNTSTNGARCCFV